MTSFDRCDDDIPEPREYGQWLSYVAIAVAVLAIAAYALLAASLGH